MSEFTKTNDALHTFTYPNGRKLVVREIGMILEEEILENVMTMGGKEPTAASLGKAQMRMEREASLVQYGNMVVGRDGTPREILMKMSAKDRAFYDEAIKRINTVSEQELEAFFASQNLKPEEAKTPEK